MPEPSLGVRLRTATLDDAAHVADLESLRDPAEPRDPLLLRHWWLTTDEHEKTMRQVAERDGEVVAFVSASHEPWDGRTRYGSVRAILRHDSWSAAEYEGLVDVGETWLRDQGAQKTVVRVREEFRREIEVLEHRGYREDRRMRISELDLVARRDEIKRVAQETSREMAEQNVEMLPLSDDPDPDKLRKLYELMIESERDIPTTVPRHAPGFEEWRRFWFENPSIRLDYFWIAREGDAIVGTSILDCPTVRGVPTTAYTGTSRRVRGRGIARALKYQSMAQAVDAGFTRVRTSNDADNPPILKINHEMGYRLVSPLVELHRNLDA